MANFFRSLFRGAPADPTPAAPLEDDSGTPQGRTGETQGRTGEPPARSAAGGGTVLDAEMSTRLARAFVVLGTELWRARGKLPRGGDGLGEGADARALRQVESSLDKMGAALETLGLRHDDPTGRTWDERDPMKVLVFEETAGLSRAQVVEVVKPTLYLGESLLAAGEVVVGVPVGAGPANEERR